MSQIHWRQQQTHGSPQTWRHRVELAPISFPSFLLVFLHMLEANYYNCHVHHVAKRCWFLSIANHKALQNMEIELAKLVIVLAMSSSFFLLCIWCHEQHGAHYKKCAKLQRFLRCIEEALLHHHFFLLMLEMVMNSRTPILYTKVMTKT